MYVICVKVAKKLKGIAKACIDQNLLQPRKCSAAWYVILFVEEEEEDIRTV